MKQLLDKIADRILQSPHPAVCILFLDDKRALIEFADGTIEAVGI